MNFIFNDILTNYNKKLDTIFPDKVDESPSIEIKKSDPNYTIDYKVYKNNRIKTLLSKNKIKSKKEEDPINEINILTLKTMADNVNNSEENSTTDIDKMPVDLKYELIEKYIQKKNINLNEDDIDKLNELLNDENIKLNKYISVSNVFGDITKISFLVKNKETNEYYIDINNLKNSKKNINKKKFLK